MYEILNKLTTIQLIDMLMSHYKLFVIPYCESVDDIIAEYDLRNVILDILSTRNEQEYSKRMAEIGA